MICSTDISFVRILRTVSSERFLAQGKANVDLAAFDVHYLQEGNVAVTLVLLAEEFSEQRAIEELLKAIDTRLLPMTSLNDNDLLFTVVHGKVVGNFGNIKDDAS